MTLRYTLSQLSRPEARRGFGRRWFWVCLVGALVSLLAFGVRHAFFIATVWFLCLFAPVRIAVEVLHTAGPRIRRQMQRDLERREDRYTTHEQIHLRVEDLVSGEVQLPRIAPPDLGAKVVDAAARLTERAYKRGDGPLGVLRAATTCGILLDRWVGTIAAGEAGSVPDAATPFTPSAGQGGGNGIGPPALWDARASIQDQWVTLRAVAALAALTKALTAVYEDSAGRLLDGSAALRAIADAAMDYADQIGLRLEGPAWEEVAGVPRTVVPPDLLAHLAETWTAFCAAPAPAPRRLLAFLESVPE
jgi:hypothetical protein